MASADQSEELECPVSLDIYTDHASLRCGHNFCRVCIDRVLNSQEVSAGYSCPECREKYKERPGLHRNIAERFPTTQPDQEEAGVHCTYCVDSPAPAVMSCLHCDASMCDKHLRFHSKAPEHVLCAPTTSPETRKCSIHKKILEYYCTEDVSCVCVTCTLAGEHRGHQVETLQEASEKKKEKLRNDLRKLMAETKEAEKRVQSLEERRRKVQEKAYGEAERVTALFRDLGRRLEELEKRVLSDITRRVQVYDDIIRQLEIKKEELSRKMRHIEELWQNRPDTPERFQDWPEVLSSRSFSSGRHYWEVDVGGSDDWRVGMCYPSIARGGDQSMIGDNNKSWCLHRRGNTYLVIYDSKEIQLPDGIRSDRIRIYLDYEAGQISFYALCDPIIRPLHTFTAIFTEPLYAVLCVWHGCIKISGGSQGV
ncbi:E3 ubiquitin-protein ligase TRIM58-like [Hyperolius riggenbachi]|uniref:E3 ubiquitin-protein ligase TRIM58-like n=1 Tax=Hyperolius riggenbachi TaxID=752182 RepID=UPI0035A3B655